MAGVSDRLGFEPAVGPPAQGLDRLVQVFAGFGECVLNADWRARKDTPRDEPGRLELPEAVGAETPGHPREGADQPVEAGRPAHQDAEDRPGPPRAAQFAGPAEDDGNE